MNIIMCSENCLHQRDGYCMLDDLTHACESPAAPCKYFQKMV